ncbi:hypothetical protein HMPREF3198_00855 [Winkia neuii]|nr:hypothetical protein HMPREF3198_00855 [Winkia neuii]
MGALLAQVFQLCKRVRLCPQVYPLRPYFADFEASVGQFYAALGSYFFERIGAHPPGARPQVQRS